MRIASEILMGTFLMIDDLIEPGITTGELDNEIESYIRNREARPAFKGYRGFPASSCISINEVVIHGIPDGRKLKEGDIVGIDIGVEKNGCFSDSAYTFPVGEINAEKQKLLDCTEKALNRAIDEMVEGNRIGDISHAIQNTAESNGFNVVRQFVGHGVGKELHEDPPVPNFGQKGRGPRLKKGMTLAIEPMINAGDYKVEVLEDGWTVVTEDGKPSAHYEHTILITEDEPEIMTESALHSKNE